MTIRSVTLAGSVIGVFLGAGYGCRIAPKAGPTQVWIGTFSQAIDYGPVYVARHFGWFEESLRGGDSVEVEYRELGGFDEIQTALTQEKLHAFFSAEAPAIKLVSDRASIRIVAIGCTLQQDVLVRKAAGINSIGALKGRSIAVAEGTSSHYGLLTILSDAGLTPADITLRPGFPGEAKPLFESGAVDAWAVWPPFVEEQVLAGRGVALTGGNARIQSVMSLHRTILEERPSIGEALVSTVERAKTWMRANPDEAIAIVAQALGLQRAVVELAWPKHNWGAQLHEEVLTDIDKKARFLKDVGVIDEATAIPGRQELVDLRFLKR